MRYHPLVKKLRFSDYPRVRQLEAKLGLDKGGHGYTSAGKSGCGSKVYEFSRVFRGLKNIQLLLPLGHYSMFSDNGLFMPS